VDVIKAATEKRDKRMARKERKEKATAQRAGKKILAGAKSSSAKQRKGGKKR
jgi:hypothetical protein